MTQAKRERDILVSSTPSEPDALMNLSRLPPWQADDALAPGHAQSALNIAIEVQDSLIGAVALRGLGNAELALGRHAAAATACERSRAVALAMALDSVDTDVATAADAAQAAAEKQRALTDASALAAEALKDHSGRVREL